MDLSWEQQQALRNPNQHDSFTGKTALHMAMNNSFTDERDFADMLIKAGANVNTVVDRATGMTLLMWAIKNHKHRYLDMLIEAGADLEESDHEGKTPMWYAVLFNNPEAVDLLLDAGAKWSNSDTELAMDSVEDDHTHRDVFKRLKKHGKK